MQILKTILFFSIGFLAISLAQAQNPKAAELYKKGQIYVGKRDFKNAIETYKKAAKADPTYARPLFSIADIYQKAGDPIMSSYYYQQGWIIDSITLPFTYFLASKIYLQQPNYDSAYYCLDRFLLLNDGKISKIANEAKRNLVNADFARVAIKNPVAFVPENLGENINTRVDEYLPATTADGKTLIFTRRLPSGEDFFSSVWDGISWSKAEQLPYPVNTDENEGAHCISPDGMTLFFTACNRIKGFGSCDLYFTERLGEGWTEPENLGAKVNTAHWESQPTVSADGNTLIFASTRPGGLGGSDLYISTRDTSGKWSEPKNMGEPINTMYEDISPFLHPDGKTLYFGSAGHPGFGGVDIFRSILGDDKKWSKPENIGWPINTPSDENTLSVSLDGTTGFFSSNSKTSGFGKFDIYSFTLPIHIRPVKSTYLSAKVVDEELLVPLSSSIELINLKNNELVYKGKSKGLDNSFLICIEVGQNYALNVSAPGYLFYSANVVADSSSTEIFEKTVKLKKIKAGNTLVLQNIFFEVNAANLRSESKPELNKLVALLQANPNLKMLVKGHTDSSGEEAFNLNLSTQRAKAVMDYLIKAGIASNRLSFKGFGSTEPIADNNTEAGKAKNRRTEFLILE